MDEEEYRERLARDAVGWRASGIITGEQERAILARYGMEGARAIRALRLGWFTTAVSIIGAIVLAAGVVLFFGSQWDTMPSWFRASAVFAGVGVSYAAGYALIYRYGMQRLGSALLLLGVLLFEAGLFLLAQIYNMPLCAGGGGGCAAPSSTLLLLAAVGAFPMAYLFGSRIIMLLALANATFCAIFELVTRYPDSPKTESVLVVIAVLGIALYAIGRLHALYRALAHYADTYVFSGLLVLLGLVYVFTFDEPWSAMIDADVQSYAAPPIVYVSIALALMLVAAQWWLRPRDVESQIDAGAQAALLAVAGIVATWPAWTGYAIVFNAVYFAVAGGLVTRGFLRGDERYINFGLAVVALGLLTRYVDVFWSLLAGSAFFMIGGLLLLGVAFALERMRRQLVRAMPAKGGAA
jgi:uncharacterized membrane protein